MLRVKAGGGCAEGFFRLGVCNGGETFGDQGLGARAPSSWGLDINVDP